mmetsp:Transcript_37570/g.86795  ORF Transcript_37570/g.86795 Transcript_37570/m.86795 type:complete len:900 (-) Transcript_37570:58-2757(-)
MLPAIQFGADIVASCSDVFGSVVAVTGDAHQTMVAKDVFRQEVRYERSAAIREDIRDAKQLMIDAIQDELMIGSIVCGICFGMLIEGSPPDDSPRILWAYWLVATVWSSTFALLGLWWALAYQTAVLNMSTHLLLHQHRFSLPDDLVVGNFGGGTVAEVAATRVAGWHRAPIELLLMLSNPFMPRTQSGDLEQKSLAVGDKRRLKKGLPLWKGDAQLVDVPFFLVGQWLLPRPTEGKVEAKRRINFQVRGKATLYIAGRPCNRTDQAWQFGNVAWEDAQAPTLSTGYFDESLDEGMKAAGAVPNSERDSNAQHAEPGEVWESFGKLKRVVGFSIFVEIELQGIVELPIYKCVLAKREDQGWVDVELVWSTPFEDVLVMVREGHVFGLEDNWPIVDFQEKSTSLHPLHEYAATSLECSMKLLGLSAVLMSASRFHDWRARIWWLEIVLIIIAILIAEGAIQLLPLRLKHFSVSAADSEHEVLEKDEKKHRALRKKVPDLKRDPSRSSMTTLAGHWGWPSARGVGRQSNASPTSRTSGGSIASVSASLNEAALDEGERVDASLNSFDDFMRPLASSSVILSHWWPLVVKILCFSSFVLVPALHWLDNPASSPTPHAPLQDDVQLGVTSWRLWEELTLPSYGLVSKVAMRTSSSELFALSGAVLWNLAEVPIHSSLLLAPILGFGFIQNDAYVLHDRLIHNVNLSVASFTEPLGGEDGDDTSLRAIAILPAEVGQVRSAAFTAWGGLAVVVASDTNISSASVLQLCWQPASLAQLGDSNSTLPVLTSVNLPVPGLGRVTALHICDAPLCGEESVLWVAAAGVIRAVGLNSGMVLVTTPAPSITLRVNTSTGNLRGDTSQSAQVLQQHDTSEIVSLSGNATHLLCLAVSVDGGRAVLSTPYPL